MSEKSKPYTIGVPYWTASYFKHSLSHIICQLYCGCYYEKLSNEEMRELLGELEIAYKNFVYFIEYQIETGYPFVFGQYDKVLEEYWTCNPDIGVKKRTRVEYYEGAKKFIDYLLSIHRNQINKGQTN